MAKLPEHMDATKLDGFRVSPESLTLIGKCAEATDADDVDASEGAAFYDHSMKDPVPAWMIASIEELGVTDLIKICRDGEKIVVTDGRTRVRAARIINAKRAKTGQEPIRVPVMTPRTGLKDNVKVMVSSNHNRKVMSMIATARMCKQMEAQHISTAEIARAIGKEKPAVENFYLPFNDLDESLQEAVQNGVMDFTTALKMKKLSRAEQKKAIEALTQAAPVTTDPATIPNAAAVEGSKAAPPAPAKKVTARDVGRALGDTRADRPTPGIFKKILAHDDAKNLDPQFLAFCRWNVDGKPPKVAGLTAIMKDIQG